MEKDQPTNRMLDLKYKPETVICMEKPGVDDHAAVICSEEYLLIDITNGHIRSLPGRFQGRIKDDRKKRGKNRKRLN